MSNFKRDETTMNYIIRADIMEAEGQYFVQYENAITGPVPTEEMARALAKEIVDMRARVVSDLVREALAVK